MPNQHQSSPPIPSTPSREDLEDDDGEELAKDFEKQFGEGSLERFLRKRMIKIHRDLVAIPEKHEDETHIAVEEDNKQPQITETRVPEIRDPEIREEVFTTIEESELGKGQLNSVQGNGIQEVTNSETQKSSWAEILNKSGVGNEQLEFIPPTMIEGKAVIKIQSNNFTMMNKKNQKLVIGSFVGKKLSYVYVKEIVTKMWKLKNPFIMNSYGASMLSFEFSNDDDRRAVLDLGSFHIASHLFIIRPWKLFIEAENEELKTIPLWVIMKNLPMELWNKKGFSQVGSAIGKPLFVDRLTESNRRTIFARVCIEVNTQCKFPSFVPIQVDDVREIKVAMEYNWRPPCCNVCDVFGHGSINCPKAKAAKEISIAEKETKAVWVRKESTEKNNVTVTKRLEEVQGIDDGWEKPGKKHSCKAMSTNKLITEQSAQGSIVESGDNDEIEEHSLINEVCVSGSDKELKHSAAEIVKQKVSDGIVWKGAVAGKVSETGKSPRIPTVAAKYSHLKHPSRVK